MTKNGSGFTEMDVVEQLGLLKSILESSTEYSIIAMDLERTIVVWNAGAKRLYGYTASEAIGQTSNILHDPEEIKSQKVDAIFDEIRRKETWSGEMVRVRKDGSHFTAFVTITLLKDSHNNSIGYTLISRDITELKNALHFLNILETSKELLQFQNVKLKKATQEAQESNRLKSEFIANVSHELRTPLNAIIGFAGLLYNGEVDPASPEYKEFLNDILLSSHQLLALINDVLDLAKIEANKMDFHPTKIDLANVLEKIKGTFQGLITEKNIQFEIEINPTLGEITIDDEKLIQIFYNYLSNALKFTPPGGKVNVRVYPEMNNQFRLEIQDTGIGIHPEDLSKLFGKFHQLDSSTTKKYSGTGLGLALVKRIVEAQGGKVGVKSTFGEGSLFYAILPCQPHYRHIISDQVKDSQEVAIGKPPTLLVVEQASRERALIVDALSQEGYEVITAENVVSAVEHHQEQRFDAIILDLLQSDMSKWEIIRSLRFKQPAEEAPPIVVKVMIEQPISLGFKIHDFLIKPAKPEELLSALKWVGANSQDNKTILIIDNDQKALAFANKTLTEHGFRVICTTNKISGLLALENEQPDVVLLDPFMSGLDGFDFLHSYRQTERGLYTPLIIWTVTKLTHDERERFKNSIQRVMLTGKDLKKNILSELEQHLPPLKAK